MNKGKGISLPVLVLILFHGQPVPMLFPIFIRSVLEQARAYSDQGDSVCATRFAFISTRQGQDFASENLGPAIINPPAARPM